MPTFCSCASRCTTTAAFLWFLLQSTLAYSSPESFVEYQGQKIALSRAYSDFNEYKDDPKNLTHSQAERVKSLMRHATFGPTFADSAALEEALSKIQFPGYGMFYANQLGAHLDSSLELTYVEIPMQNENRYFVLERLSDQSFRVVADFVASASPEIARVHRTKAGELEYSTIKGVRIAPRTSH